MHRSPGFRRLAIASALSVGNDGFAGGCSVSFRRFSRIRSAAFVLRRSAIISSETPAARNVVIFAASRSAHVRLRSSPSADGDHRRGRSNASAIASARAVGPSQGHQHPHRNAQTLVVYGEHATVAEAAKPSQLIRSEASYRIVCDLLLAPGHRHGVSSRRLDRAHAAPTGGVSTWRQISARTALSMRRTSASTSARAMPRASRFSRMHARLRKT